MTRRPIPVESLRDLAHAESGLRHATVAERQMRYGFNDVVSTPIPSWTRIVWRTLQDPMVWFLMAAALLFAVLGQHTEAIVLTFALIPLMGMDSYLHQRTQASIQGLAGRLASQARALRDSELMVIPARELVPGDVVEVKAGEFFPADGLVLTGHELQADESSLTGESLPVVKISLPSTARQERSANVTHWAFAGTRLLTGTARVLIVATGATTLYGDIVRTALSGAHALTPLQKAVTRLVLVLLAAALCACVGLGVVRWLQGHGLADAFLSAATLAVAALPEEFPVVLTFFLGVGVLRLARRQALVRRAVAVENIGRVTCICSDKTGTLTEGRLKLSHIHPRAGVSERDLVRVAALASRAESGDPMDEALAPAAEAASVRRLATFPFTERRRCETAIVQMQDQRVQAVVKGAPETLLTMCTLDRASRESWLNQIAHYASTGHKVIAVARQDLPVSTDVAAEPRQGFELQGLLVFEDPVRAGVRDAIAECLRGGVRLLIVTGDHPATAQAIGREVGLGQGHPTVALAEAITGDREGQLARRLEGIDIVARATPAQKLALVKALQQAGEVVAVTGDGVNDVPALQIADVGIAMGERGVQSAKEVAAIVLLDDNFRTIVRAIAEGRQLFLNLQWSFLYILLVHIPLAVSAAVVPLAGYPLLYLPIHIVWLELLIHPTALLVFQELPASQALRPLARSAGLHFFSVRTWGLLLGIGLVLAAAVGFGFVGALATGASDADARTLALAVLIVSSVSTVMVLSRLATRTAKWTVALTLATLPLFVHTPALAALMHLAPLSLTAWALVLAVALLIALLTVGARASVLGRVDTGAHRAPSPPACAESLDGRKQEE